MVDRYSSEIVAVIKVVEYDQPPTMMTHRVAVFGGMYADPDDSESEPVHYQGNIKSDVVFKKTIGNEFWKEKSGIDFGYLDLALEDQDDDLIDFGKEVMVATVEFYRVNLSSPAEEQLEILASARTTDIGFPDDFTLRLRLESILRGGFEAPINEKYYGYEYEHLTGKPYPIAWGDISDPWQTLPTIAVDGTTLLYHITDLEIDVFKGNVYDRGVVIVQPTGFTPTDYGFYLLHNPAGTITSGGVYLFDPHDPGEYMHGLFRFFRLAMTRADIWSYVNQDELNQLESDIGFGDLFPQYFTMRETKLETFMLDILGGVTGWYYVDELTEIHFGRMVDPDKESALPYAFTDTNVAGRIKVEDDKAPGLTKDLAYAYNPGAHDDLAGYPEDNIVHENTEYIVSSDGLFRYILWTGDQANFTADDVGITGDGFFGEEYLEPTTTVYWDTITTREPVTIHLPYTEGSPSAFELAQEEIDRWWRELYQKRRRFYTFTVKLNDVQFNDALPQLGEFCTLQSDRFKLLNEPKNLFMRRMEFNYSKNLLTIEGWG